MKTVTVKKAELLEKLRSNRQRHHELYLKAEEGYRITVIEELNRQLMLAQKGVPTRRYIEFDPPSDHTDDYDLAIQMLEMSVSETVTIEAHELQCYVRDKWPWFSETLIKNTAYAAKGPRGPS